MEKDPNAGDPNIGQLCTNADVPKVRLDIFTYLHNPRTCRMKIRGRL